MTGSTHTPMKRVNGLIKVKEDITETTVIPAGQYVSMKEYSETTGQSYSTVRKRVSLGKLPTVVLNGRRMIQVSGKYKIKSKE